MNLLSIMCILVQIRIRLVPRPTQNRALPVLADRLTSPPDHPSRHLTNLGKSWPTRALTECPPSQRSVRQNQRHLSHACDVVSHTHPHPGPHISTSLTQNHQQQPSPSLTLIHSRSANREERKERREEERRRKKKKKRKRRRRTPCH